jgi:protoporphyrin/coproporphyrin ferrochelatase
MSSAVKKRAVVLFNLGGPDRPEAIRPFLLNLFRDPAILRVPFFVRPFLARIIARARVKPATENYALLGGKSPLLELTQRQADALERELGAGTRCFIAMRYWHPFSLETARAVKAFAPDEVFLLPLYPQYSTTTTGRSLTAWREAAATAGLVVRTTVLCCYSDDAGFAASIADLLRATLMEARREIPAGTRLRVLFSAHGLPEKIVQQGDPYQSQVERSTAAVLSALGEDVDWTICYQSRATPQKWISPSTDDEIARAGREKMAVVVVPIAFVSDHSETLVELDVEYRELAHKEGVPGYFRVPVPNESPLFISALADLVRGIEGPGLCADRAGGICPAVHKDCPHRLAEAAA